DDMMTEKHTCNKTITNHQDMTGCRVETSVRRSIVTRQHNKICPRTRIGMRRETAGIGVCAITKIPVVTREAWSSSIENSRTARGDSRKRHKVNPRRGLNDHEMAGCCFDIAGIRSRQDEHGCARDAASMSG